MKKPSADPLRPRKPERRNGIARYEKLLASVEAVLAEKSARDLSIYDIAADSGIPPASVYHFFPSPTAAIVALSEVYTDEMQRVMSAPVELKPDADWTQIVAELSDRIFRYYAKNPVARKLMVGFDYTINVREVDMESNRVMAGILLSAIEAQFDLPEDPTLIDKFEIVVTMHSSLTALSVTRTGEFKREMEQEIVRAAVVYLRDVFRKPLPRRPVSPALPTDATP
ncbi:MAG: TetR/AcrR family transcriptional regulator [Pseudomonadota bacterium]